MGARKTPAPRQQRAGGNPELLTPAELAAAFGVHAKTVTRWDKRLPEGATVRTPGNHRRYVRAVLAQHYPGVFPPASDGGAS